MEFQFVQIISKTICSYGVSHLVLLETKWINFSS